ncbi:hypothetical protein Tco_0804205 [Tanacetum coccineum]|uniref:Uncharacterized protein n=1 Tax=Tanacetum coccineum TaxID=301880 RepID=A0ABQ5A7H4_9ASTR
MDAQCLLEVKIGEKEILKENHGCAQRVWYKQWEEVFKEGSATLATSKPSTLLFGDDETIARSLLTLKPLPKIDPKDKGKKKIEEEDESESESDGIPEAEKKFK